MSTLIKGIDRCHAGQDRTGQDRFYELESIKAIGACMIAFFWHYGHFDTPNGQPMHALFSLLYDYGYVAVELFFMLSGFGMMVGYGERILNKKINFQEYIKKRILKIYPLAFFSILLMTALQLIYQAITGNIWLYSYFDIFHFIQNILCVQGGIIGADISFNGPAWSLSMFLACYIIFYYVAYKSKNKNEIYYRFIAIMLVGATIIRSGINYPAILNAMVGRGLCSFSIGVLLYCVYENRSMFNYHLLGYVFLTLIIGSIIVFYIWGAGIFGSMQWVATLGIWPMLILSVLFIPWLSKAFRWRPLVFWGTQSMYLYLLHTPVQCLIRVIDEFCNLGLDYSSKQVWLLYVLLSIAVTLIYAQNIEKPYRKLMRKIWLKTV